MEKQKVYRWQDTNLALFGSDLEKKIKRAAAEGEPQWKDVGKKPELRIWRIEQFRVVPWPKEKYGSFHRGDSYVVLHAYKKSDNSEALNFDIFFWIGSESTQDEYGTAAYKTVELDHILGDVAIQHRECEENESKLFRSLFPYLQYLEGGVASGFRHVEQGPIETEPRLLHVKGEGKSIALREVKCRRDKMNSGDVFILDTGAKMYQWNGKDANPNEKLKAQAFIKSVISARSGKATSMVLDEGSGDETCKEFWDKIPGERKLLGIKFRKYSVKTAEQGGDDAKVKQFQKVLYRLSDRSGEMKFTRVEKATKDHSNKVTWNKLDDDDVFLLDDGFMIWVWIGKGASQKERAQAMWYAMKYIKEYNRPTSMPISRIDQGREPLTFTENFGEFAEGGCFIM